MGALQAKENIWYVGVQDPGLRVFDIIMHSDHGTSYNSYIVKGTEKTVLFETSRAAPMGRPCDAHGGGDAPDRAGELGLSIFYPPWTLVTRHGVAVLFVHPEAAALGAEDAGEFGHGVSSSTEMVRSPQHCSSSARGRTRRSISPGESLLRR